MLPFLPFQRTVKKALSLTGKGVHRDLEATLTIKPLKENQGILFKRSDLPENNTISLTPAAVVDTRFCTTIGNEHGVTVSTVEHLLAALAALQITNILIEVSGPEMPIMHGNSEDFVTLLQTAGIVTQKAPAKKIRILKPVQIQEGNRWIRLEPSEGLHFDFTLDFQGREGLQAQAYSFEYSLETFLIHIVKARSFGFFADAEKLHALGLAKGSSLENAVIIKEGAILNPEGLHYDVEMVRHKILDTLGDFYVAGALIQGRCQALNAGHELNNKLLRAVLEDCEAFEVVSSHPIPSTAAEATIVPFVQAPVRAQRARLAVAI